MTLPRDQLNALEQTRQRLLQIQKGLDALRFRLNSPSADNNPLPAWTALQESAESFARNMEEIQYIFAKNRDFVTAAHAYPHANFPATKPEAHNVLTELLRKKAEPDAEAWVSEHTERRRDGSVEQGLGVEEQKELWFTAAGVNVDIFNEMDGSGAFEYEYTLAENVLGVAGVKTGLRRKLEGRLEKDREEEEEEEEEMEEMEVDGEGEGMEDVMPAKGALEQQDGKGMFVEVKGVELGAYALRLEEVLRFVSAGVMPVAR